MQAAAGASPAEPAANAAENGGDIPLEPDLSGGAGGEYAPDILPESWYAVPDDAENLKDFLSAQDTSVSLKYVAAGTLILDNEAVDAQNIWGRLLTYFRAKNDLGFFAGMSAAEDMHLTGGCLTVRVPEHRLNFFKDNAERLAAALKELGISVKTEFTAIRDGKEQERAELEKVKRMLGGLPLNIIK